MSETRLSVMPSGNERDRLKALYRDGTTQLCAVVAYTLRLISRERAMLDAGGTNQRTRDL